MEDIITRARISKSWTRSPMELKIVPKTSRDDRRPEQPSLKRHKCGRTANLAKTCSKKTKINEDKVMEEVQCAKEKEGSDQGSSIYDDTQAEDYPIEKNTAFFEVT
ncbi:hypothetical protein O181_020990 [Austropuccinia psidii MF-1]|uniref:Uncharacterized protein n=1 Tax=Austropuccinia psidii MF-1 TaxID=1389203 RepID=A0A9Q3CEU8_9BASI|nr:hypothetical protein [Austropuccinia psidii MF-1]